MITYGVNSHRRRDFLKGIKFIDQRQATLLRRLGRDGRNLPCKGKSPVETNWELVEFKSELIENVSKIRVSYWLGVRS